MKKSIHGANMRYFPKEKPIKIIKQRQQGRLGMFDKLKEIKEKGIGKIKDAGLSKAAQVAINNFIKEYGKIVHLNIDSTNKTIDLEILLEGEAQPLAVTIKEYDILQKEGQYFVKIDNIQTSRAWINTLATNYLNGKTFAIPKEYASVIQKIL